MSRPQYGLPPLELPRALSITRSLASSGGEEGLFCHDDGKKRAASGRKLGTLAQTIAVLTSATDQLMGDTPVSRVRISFKKPLRHDLLTCDIYRAKPIKPSKTENTSRIGTRVRSACSIVEVGLRRNSQGTRTEEENKLQLACWLHL
jgi:hypothetical protein